MRCSILLASCSSVRHDTHHDVLTLRRKKQKRKRKRHEKDALSVCASVRRKHSFIFHSGTQQECSKREPQKPQRTIEQVNVSGKFFCTLKGEKKSTRTKRNNRHLFSLARHYPSIKIKISCRKKNQIRVRRRRNVWW